MSLSYALRLAEERDAPRIAALHIESWKAAYAVELPASFLLNQDLAQRAEEWRERIYRGAGTVLLAESADVLLAFCAHGWTEDSDAASATWEIMNLHVQPDLRGGGVGGVLFDRALRAARAAGALQLTLWVVETNMPARRFYQRRGMRHEVGSQKLHVIAPDTVLKEVRYVLPLR